MLIIKVGCRGEHHIAAHAGDVGRIDTRGLFALSVTAGICWEAQRLAIDDDLVCGIAGGRFRTLHVTSGYDGTPMLLEFGAMSTALIPHARFFAYDA